MAAESASECSAGSDVELLRRDRSRGSFGSLSSLTQMDPKTQLVVEMQGGAYAPAPEMRGRPTRLTHGQLRYEYIGRGRRHHWRRVLHVLDKARTHYEGRKER